MKILRRQKKAAVKPARGQRPASADTRVTLSTFGGSLIALESRIMFDGAAVATVSTVTTEQIAQSQADAVPLELMTRRQPTARLLRRRANRTPLPATRRCSMPWRHTIHRLPARRSCSFPPASSTTSNSSTASAPTSKCTYSTLPATACQQMAEILAGRTGIDAIHLIGDGTEAEMHLGASFLTQDSISTTYAEQFQQIGQSLSANADLLIYGCNFGQWRGRATGHKHVGRPHRRRCGREHGSYRECR